MFEFTEAAHDHFASGSLQPWLVALSLMIAFLASCAALQTAARIGEARGRMRMLWIVAGGVVLGGGIWSMHFIGMLAHELPFPVSYDLTLTVLSLLLAVALTTVGLVLVSREKIGPLTLPGAGLLTASGVAGMHYLGMAAMRMPARLLYEPYMFGLSLLVAFVAATAALGIARRRTGLFVKLAASLVMTVAIAGMHYVGMAAARFEPQPTIALGKLLFLEANYHAVRPEVMAVFVALGAILVVVIVVASAAVDKRFAISAAREAEALRLGQQRMAALLENATDLIVVTNDGATVLEAAGPHELAKAALGRNIADLAASDDGVRLAGLVALVAGGACASATDEIRIDLAGRGARACDVLVRDLRHDRAVGGLVISFHDVEERSAVQAAMAEARDIADSASRAKSRFISMMSHELRTPLAAILGYADLIGARMHGPLGAAAYDGYVDEIGRAGRRLITMVDAIIGLGRIDGGEEVVELRRVEAQGMLRLAVRTAAEKARRAGVRLEHVDNGPVHVLADPRCCTRVLDHVFDNAIKFTEADGEVVVLVEVRPDGIAALTISDTGIGIPPESLAHVAEPFFQADDGLSRRFEGAGLGLTVAKALTELQGGTIDIDSTYGFGTTVRLCLPIVVARNLAGADDDGPGTAEETAVG